MAHVHRKEAREPPAKWQCFCQPYSPKTYQAPRDKARYGVDSVELPNRASHFCITDWACDEKVWQAGFDSPYIKNWGYGREKTKEGQDHFQGHVETITPMCRFCLMKNIKYIFDNCHVETMFTNSDPYALVAYCAKDGQYVGTQVHSHLNPRGRSRVHPLVPGKAVVPEVEDLGDDMDLSALFRTKGPSGEHSGERPVQAPAMVSEGKSPKNLSGSYRCKSKVCIGHTVVLSGAQSLIDAIRNSDFCTGIPSPLPKEVSVKKS